MKRFFVDFVFKTQVTGYVMAMNVNQAKAKVLECSNPEFDEMNGYSMPTEPEIEFESCFEDEA